MYTAVLIILAACVWLLLTYTLHMSDQGYGGAFYQQTWVQWYDLIACGLGSVMLLCLLTFAICLACAAIGTLAGCDVSAYTRVVVWAGVAFIASVPPFSYIAAKIG